MLKAAQIESTSLKPWQDVQRFAQAALIRRRWLLGVLSFWGDESGSHGDGPFVLSGYLGPDDVWTAFQDEWHAVLQNAPTINFFHMRECFKLEGQFQGFTRYQADHKRDQLIDVLRPRLRNKELVEFSAILEWDVYQRAVHGPLKETYHNPYFFALHPIVAEIAKYLWERPEWNSLGRVDFFFDDQAIRVERDTAFQFYNVKDTASERYAAHLGDVAFRNDELNYPLQAADLIAWQVHRRELNLPADGHQPRKEYLRLKGVSDGGRLMRCREDRIQALANRVAAGLRADIWK